MSTLNSYAALAEYKSFVIGRGQNASVDISDDTVIENLLKSSSRYLDDHTDRFFYPYIQTRYYDVPTSEQLDPRELKLHADLLEVLSLANGDGTAITSTYYDLRPRNDTPYSKVRLKDNASVLWVSNTSGNVHDVIPLNGIWGYHNRYAQAWLLATITAEALDTSETGTDVTSGTLFNTGDLIRIDNEFMYVSGKDNNTLTNTRAENGSTAAAHDSGASVYIWQVMDEVKTNTLETAMQAVKRRFGQSNSNTQTITGAGVVLTPRDVPVMTAEFIRTHRYFT